MNFHYKTDDVSISVDSSNSMLFNALVNLYKNYKDCGGIYDYCLSNLTSLTVKVRNEIDYSTSLSYKKYDIKITDKDGYATITTNSKVERDSLYNIFEELNPSLSYYKGIIDVDRTWYSRNNLSEMYFKNCKLNVFGTEDFENKTLVSAKSDLFSLPNRRWRMMIDTYDNTVSFIELGDM